MKWLKASEKIALNAKSDDTYSISLCLWVNGNRMPFVCLSTSTYIIHYRNRSFVQCAWNVSSNSAGTKQPSTFLLTFYAKQDTQLIPSPYRTLLHPWVIILAVTTKPFHLFHIRWYNTKSTKHMCDAHVEVYIMNCVDCICFYWQKW